MAIDQPTLEEAFGQALRHFRQAAGMSQEELSDCSGLHRTYVSQLERGLKSPSLTAIEALARALGQLPHVLVKAAEDRRQ